MQSDKAIGIINNLPYPFISRINRQIYQQYPQVDPARLYQRCLIAAVIGYFCGKIAQRRETLFSFLFPLPLIAHFLYQEWKLAKEGTLPVYGSVTTVRTYTKTLQKNDKNKQEIQGVMNTYHFKHARKMPLLEQKIYTAKDLIKQLPDSYFM